MIGCSSISPFSRLPVWSQRLIAKICNYFYVTEKAWNFYPFTITGENLFSSSSFYLSDLPGNLRELLPWKAIFELS